MCPAAGAFALAFASESSISAPIDTADESHYELIVCDAPGSAAHAVGIGLEFLVKLELLPTTGVNLTSSTSSSRNGCLTKIRNEVSTFAIMDRTVLDSAPDRSLTLGSDVRPLLIAALWPQAAHFVISKDHLLSGTIGDYALLSSDQLIIDPALLHGASQLLAKAGITMERSADELPPEPLEAMVDSFLRDDTIGLAMLEPVPSPMVTEFLARAGDDAVLLELSARHVQADGKGWRPMQIPPDSYLNVNQPIETFGNGVMLVAEADVADETVYQTTKIMFDNLPKLWQVHDIATQISIDRALEDADLPLHPGAARYYREIGVLPHEAGPSREDRAGE